MRQRRWCWRHILSQELKAFTESTRTRTSMDSFSTTEVLEVCSKRCHHGKILINGNEHKLDTVALVLHITTNLSPLPGLSWQRKGERD